MVRRLQKLSGELVYKEGQQQVFFKRVHQYVAKKTKDEDTKAGTREPRVLCRVSRLLRAPVAKKWWTKKNS